MRILIVEDETAAYENLVDILTEIDLGVQITGYTESISQTIHWLQNNPAPDLILMDIHLSDGSAFSIFKAMQVETPVIFTTAYDEYALDAFKVNSIDYLLKPIKVEELRNALEKFNKLKQPDILQYLSQLNRLSQVSKQRDKILIPYKDQLLPVDLTDVACFYSTEKNTRIYLRNGKWYPYCKTLDQICATLDPVNYIRANKQFIIARQSVKNITIWFDNRLLITLEVEVPERIYVSKNKAAEFKAWVTSEQ